MSALLRAAPLRAAPCLPIAAIISCGEQLLVTSIAVSRVFVGQVWLLEDNLALVTPTLVCSTTRLTASGVQLQFQHVYKRIWPRERVFFSTMARLTNYAAFVDSSTGVSRVGHYDLEQKTIQPLSLNSGTPIANLYQVINAGSASIVAVGDAVPVSSVKVLPPLSGRDVLAVGKNYMEHAKEFNSSGYDASDRVDRPSHPVIFTKRATSIIGDGESIYPHPEFTESADYEGEIGVIIGKPGFRISEENAWSHVWGFTIINDVTARERQRDHKQFYIGKSPDTFCPMVRTKESARLVLVADAYSRALSLFLRKTSSCP